MSSLQEPGKKAAKSGEYVEPDPRGRNIEHRKVAMDKGGTSLPPTHVKGLTWVRVGPPVKKLGGPDEHEPKVAAIDIDTLRESLKQELDHFNDAQLQKVAELIAILSTQTAPIVQESVMTTTEKTATERADDFLVWVSHLPQIGRSLPDEAFDRGNLYD